MILGKNWCRSVTTKHPMAKIIKNVEAGIIDQSFGTLEVVSGYLGLMWDTLVEASPICWEISVDNVNAKYDDLIAARGRKETLQEDAEETPRPRPRRRKAQPVTA